MQIDSISTAAKEPRPQFLTRSIFDTVKANINHELTERQYLTLLVLSMLQSEDKTTGKFSNAFLRHTALLAQLRLSERLIEVSDLSNSDSASVLLFCEEATTVLHSAAWAGNMRAWQCDCDVADLVDGRLLAACLRDASIGRNEYSQSLLRVLASLGANGISDETEVVDSSEGKSTPFQSHIRISACRPQRHQESPAHLGRRRQLQFETRPCFPTPTEDANVSHRTNQESHAGRTAFIGFLCCPAFLQQHI